jgi:beta-glucosidase
VLEDAGGWPARDTALRFADYAERVHEALGDRIRFWTTLNEPFCSSLLGYAAGVHAPGRREPAAAIRAIHHLLLGHGLAIQAMRAGGGADHEYGITLNLTPAIPESERAEDLDAARRADGIANRIFLDPILRGSYPDDVVADLAPLLDFGHVQDGDLATMAQPLDALGINYYFRHLVRAGSGERFEGTPLVGAGDVEMVSRGLPQTEMGWEIDPDGLHAILTRVWREYAPPPLWVTENGRASADVVDADGGVHDADRIDYLDRHFRAAHRALDEGVDLRGYFVWTLMDNFEWAYGESRRFGLVHVDYETQQRTPKDSAAWFAGVIARNGLGDEAGTA